MSRTARGDRMRPSILDAIPNRRLALRGERLLRSRLDIAQLLADARASGDPIVTEFEDDELFFVAQILRVDETGGSVTASWSPSKAANRLLLGRKRVRFHCNHAGARLEFVASRPEEAEFEGRPALRFALPRALLVLHRRAHPRIAVPEEVRLACRIPIGSETITADVVDISAEGLGTLVHDAAVRIRPGSVIRDATLLHPDLGPLRVGLKVRHTTRVRRRDGRIARRMGCSFVGRPAELQALIDLFVVDLEAPADKRGNLP